MALLEGEPVGSALILLRRGSGVLRWDASLWVVPPAGAYGLPVAMLSVGFGPTKRSALRRMRRPDHQVPLDEI